ncbi:MAG: hypothetical protein PHF11_05280 [Candidatus Omnitrophica bacterium]|nr:hypothetical protein [Candidatus Omnitrophota bacterium]
MIGIGLLGIKEVALMFALGFGYIICSLAKKQDKSMQGLGHLIGIVIIVLSSALILVNLYYFMFNPFAGCRSCWQGPKSGIMKPSMMMERTPMPAPMKK